MTEINSQLNKCSGFKLNLNKHSILHKFLINGYTKSKNEDSSSTNSFPIKIFNIRDLNNKETITCQFCKENLLQFITIPCGHPVCFKCKFNYFKSLPIKCSLCKTIVIVLNKCY